MCFKVLPNQCRWCGDYIPDNGLQHDKTGMRKSPCNNFRMWDDWDKYANRDSYRFGSGRGCDYFRVEQEKCLKCEMKFKCL